MLVTISSIRINNNLNYKTSHYYNNLHGWLRNLPKNYRPVALTSHFIKILEFFLAKNIHQFLETHQKMNPKQQVFRSGRSCLSQLLERHNKILEELKKSNNVDVIYLDFGKAFDKVVHGILLNVTHDHTSASYSLSDSHVTPDHISESYSLSDRHVTSDHSSASYWGRNQGRNE